MHIKATSSITSNILKERNVTNNSCPGGSTKYKQHDQEQEQHQDHGQGQAHVCQGNKFKYTEHHDRAKCH